jgi:6,7-dimethyl-8-ribityllumazine synthase
MHQVIEGQLSASGKSFGLIVSRFNDFICERLMNGAIDALKRNGADESDITIVKVPGAFEIPLIAQKMASSDNYHAIIAIGAVIRGATSHYDYVCAEVSKGIASVSLNTGIPVLFGVLTTDTIEQAIERAGSKAGNKGFEAAMAAIEMVNIMEKI